MLQQALDNRARSQGVLEELYSARREGRSPDLVKARKARKPRKASAYSKRYGKAFKKVMKKFKKKNGSWKTNGFKNAQKAAHKLAKRK